MKAVIFDLDNTIYDENDYIKVVINHFCKKNKLNLIPLDDFLSDELRLTSKDILGDYLRAIESYSKELQQELFECYLSINCELSPYSDFIDLASYLKSKEIKLCIITNGVVEAQKNKIKCLNISEYFDSIIYAREDGKHLEKPHENSFNKALASLGVKNVDAIYVGDNPDTDIAGAKKSGLMAIRLMNGYCKGIECSDEDKRINTLKELKEIIDVY